jgi:phenylpropionate dioxygenase-like ring-hydroxylating dioxygenase large terminal subunit
VISAPIGEFHLSYGRLVDEQVECPYHGWKFDCEGTCTEIPSLLPDQGIDSTKIKVRSYSTFEQQGVVWIFMNEKGTKIMSDEGQRLSEMSLALKFLF